MLATDTECEIKQHLNIVLPCLFNFVMALKLNMGLFTLGNNKPTH